jgi:hypothetical protein
MTVECRSESSYPEKPIYLTWEGQHREIIDIPGRWRTPEGDHFRVRTHDGLEFQLTYLVATDSWDVQPA